MKIPPARSPAPVMGRSSDRGDSGVPGVAPRLAPVGLVVGGEVVRQIGRRANRRIHVRQIYLVGVVSAPQFVLMVAICLLSRSQRLAQEVSSLPVPLGQEVRIDLQRG